MARRYKCGLCNENGHNARTCTESLPELLDAEERSAGPRLNKCGICREPGHNRERCPQNPRIKKALKLYRDDVPIAQIVRRTKMSRKKVYRAAHKAGLHVPASGPPRWQVKHPGLADRLGKERDNALAEDYGVSRERIRQCRGFLGIAKYKRPPIEESHPRLIERLGEEDDCVLAAEFGLGVSFVRNLRLKRRIFMRDIRPVEERHPGLIEKLGTGSDYSVAKEFKISPSGVRIIRINRGIPTANPRNVPIEVKFPGITEKLGTVPDLVLAQEYGISAGYVYLMRGKADVIAWKNRKNR